MSNPLGRSPLAPAPRPEPPVYGTPTAPIRFFPVNAHVNDRDREFIASFVKDYLWRCPWCGMDDLGSVHICWNGLLHCELCGQAHRAVCDGVQWRVPEHNCRILVPFLDEARRQR